MPKYKVTIKTTAFYQVEVNADNEAFAERIALYNTEWEQSPPSNQGARVYHVEEIEE